MPRNSIGTQELKNNAVATGKIRNNAVTSKKVLNDSLTGEDIDESTLSKVPSSSLADSSTTAVNATQLGGIAASSYINATKTQVVDRFFLSNGESRMIASAGQLSFTAKCAINSSGNDIATITINFIRNSLGDNTVGAAFDSFDNGALGSDTVEGDREYAVSSATTGGFSFSEESDGIAVDPNGVMVTTRLFTGTNALNQSGKCAFGGVFFIHTPSS